MAMSLRVVVPPHPLIAHWLTLLRDRETPSSLFATGLAELGRWLTYEAIRDWLPERTVTIQTPLAPCEGRVVDSSVPVLAVPLLRGGMGLWQGAQTVLPAARVAHVGVDVPGLEDPARWYLDDLPAHIAERVGVLVFLPILARGVTALAVLERLQQLGVSGPRLRVITPLAAAPGLKRLGERIPDLTLYTACIDPDLDASGNVIPGIGAVARRLYGSMQATIG